MKVFFIIRGLHDPGGIERVTCVLSNELVKRGYDIGIICLQKGTPFFPLDTLVKVHYLPGFRFTRIHYLKKVYTSEKPDIVVFVGSHRLFMNIPAAKGIANITWEHFNTNINWHPLHPASRSLAAKYSDKIVTLTRQDEENYTKKFAAKNVISIPNPITIDNIQPTPLTEKRVLAVGRLASQKGFDLLLDAWKKTNCRKDGWKLRIIGSGRRLKKLQEQIKENNLEESVEMLPTTKNITEQYKQASIFVMSSRYEGLPLVLIEAMAAGLPIVSFDCETGPREVVVNKKTGLLVSSADTAALADAIDEMASNEIFRKECSTEALKRSELFHPSNIVERWEKLFKEILNKK